MCCSLTSSFLYAPSDVPPGRTVLAQSWNCIVSLSCLTFMFLIGCAFVPAVLHRTPILSLVNPIHRRFRFLFLFFLAFHFYFYFSVHHPLPTSNVRNMVSRTARPLHHVSYFPYDVDINHSAFQSPHFVEILWGNKDSEKWSG